MYCIIVYIPALKEKRLIGSLAFEPSLALFYDIVKNYIRGCIYHVSFAVLKYGHETIISYKIK